jgi:uncharacterized protein (DUF2267 family)
MHNDKERNRMAQHRDPLERDRDQPGTQPDPATEGVSHIGDTASVFQDDPSGSNPGSDDTADSGMDPGRTRAMQEASQDDGKLPPPAEYRADSVVRATSPGARVEMERGNRFNNDTSMTKGHNAPPADLSRMPYTTEQMDEFLTEGRRGIFPDTPGGAGATPLSADKDTFIDTVARLGHFPSRKEAEKWTRAVFNTLRHHTYEVDDRALMDELKNAVRFGEAPEVQVEEMMWGGDFVDRFSRMTSLLQNWPKQEFYKQLAEEAKETPDDPWVDAAAHSFFGALKQALGENANNAVPNLGEMQEVWDRA